MSLRWLPLLSLGCSAPVVDGVWDGGAFFQVSGPVEIGAVEGEHVRAAIAWVWVVDGRLGGTVEEVPFEPRVHSYALQVNHPPDPSGDGRAPEGLDLGVDLLWGVPLLLDTPDDALEVEVDSAALLDWIAGAAQLSDVLAGDVAAGTHEHVVMGLDAGGVDLADTSWTAGGPWCVLDGMVAGLTLYRRDDLDCGGWRALAPAGARTDFQGVPMGAIGGAP